MQALFQSTFGEGRRWHLGSGAKSIVRRVMTTTSYSFFLLNILSCIAAQSLPQLDEVTQVKSVFIDNSRFGKDPFFPKSPRREVVVDAANTNSIVEPAQVTSLVLKGISRAGGKPLVIINNRTFEVGEEIPMRVANQILKVRCVEIRDKSVIISVNGQTMELFMGQRL